MAGYFVNKARDYRCLPAMRDIDGGPGGGAGSAGSGARCNGLHEAVHEAGVIGRPARSARSGAGRRTRGRCADGDAARPPGAFHDGPAGYRRHAGIEEGRLAHPRLRQERGEHAQSHRSDVAADVRGSGRVRAGDHAGTSACGLDAGQGTGQIQGPRLPRLRPAWRNGGSIAFIIANQRLDRTPSALARPLEQREPHAAFAEFVEGELGLRHGEGVGQLLSGQIGDGVCLGDALAERMEVR